MQGVKGVEKFFLSRFFASNELNIIYKENIGGAIFVSEGGSGLGADGVDEIIGKFFGGNVEDI